MLTVTEGQVVMDDTLTSITIADYPQFAKNAAKSKVLQACPAAWARLLVSFCGMQSASHRCLPVFTSVAYASV